MSTLLDPAGPSGPSSPVSSSQAIVSESLDVLIAKHEAKINHEALQRQVDHQLGGELIEIIDETLNLLREKRYKIIVAVNNILQLNNAYGVFRIVHLREATLIGRLPEL